MPRLCLTAKGVSCRRTLEFALKKNTLHGGKFIAYCFGNACSFEFRGDLLSCSFAFSSFDESLILPVEKLRTLPKNWSGSPPPLPVQRIGVERSQKKASVVLQVSSAILPVEYNYLINIEHPGFFKS